MDKTTRKAIQISEAVHEVLRDKAKATGKKIIFLAERAILRCYGNGAK